jgi:thimet oligopeptidase
MNSFYCIILAAVFLSACISCTDSDNKKSPDNPLLVPTNTPVEYAKVTADHLKEYAQETINEVSASVETIRKTESPGFDNIVGAMDDVYNKLNKASNNCFMLYWVSPDSLSRAEGLAGYQRLDSLTTTIFSDKLVFNQLVSVQSSEDYAMLENHRKLLVDQMIQQFKLSGSNLSDEQLTTFKKLTKEINELSASYSTNMNSSDEVLVLEEKAADGLPDNFRKSYATGEFKYTIPIANATREPVMNNARSEETRKAYYMKFYNRAADTNLAILDELVMKRHELAQVMGYKTYAAYSLDPKMAKNPDVVWGFINDLVNRSKEKAKKDVELLKQLKKATDAGSLQPWDMSFYNNEILKNRYAVDNEKIREYLPMKKCLEGVFTIYQKLLGLEFRKVENPSVWHEEVEMYEVYEKNNLKGRFYLDLFPRPNKESWFYAVGITPGKSTSTGYEVPVAMLLGNFTRPTESLPSLLSHNELNTLFHEFGHIMNAMAYEGEFAYQSNSKPDFVEAMSQIFENWTWNYDMLSTFAYHYKTGEVLPRETFDNMVRAKNVGSGLALLGSLRRCTYDLNLYDRYNPEMPVNTDDIWKNIDEEFGVMPMHVDGTHVQASWIHINTHPVYMYGYLWSEVYAQDMFTVFEKNGLTDEETGIRYRKLILANGMQRDIEEAVEEFLGRPSNNEAYIKSLGLD